MIISSRLSDLSLYMTLILLSFSWLHAVHLRWLEILRIFLLIQVVTQLETRVLTHHSLSLTQKATRAIRHIADHAKAEELTTALDALLSRHHTELEDFSKDHDTKLEYIQRLTSQSSHYKNKQAVTIQNAMLHAKYVEVNAGTYIIYRP
jgi:hypothetical protein